MKLDNVFTFLQESFPKLLSNSTNEFMWGERKKNKLKLSDPFKIAYIDSTKIKSIVKKLESSAFRCSFKNIYLFHFFRLMLIETFPESFYNNPRSWKDITTLSLALWAKKVATKKAFHTLFTTWKKNLEITEHGNRELTGLQILRQFHKKTIEEIILNFRDTAWKNKAIILPVYLREMEFPYSSEKEMRLIDHALRQRTLIPKKLQETMPNDLKIGKNRLYDMKKKLSLVLFEIPLLHYSRIGLTKLLLFPNSRGVWDKDLLESYLLPPETFENRPTSINFYIPHQCTDSTRKRLMEILDEDEAAFIITRNSSTHLLNPLAYNLAKKSWAYTKTRSTPVEISFDVGFDPKVVKKLSEAHLDILLEVIRQMPSDYREIRVDNCPSTTIREYFEDLKNWEIFANLVIWRRPSKSVKTGVFFVPSNFEEQGQKYNEVMSDILSFKSPSVSFIDGEMIGEENALGHLVWVTDEKNIVEKIKEMTDIYFIGIQNQLHGSYYRFPRDVFKENTWDLKPIENFLNAKRENLSRNTLDE